MKRCLRGAVSHSLHDGMTVRCDGEEWALDFAQELTVIDAVLNTAGIDTQRLKQ
jgi:hypothetical protein